MKVTAMVKHKQAPAHLQSKHAGSTKEDIFVNITLRHVPGDLVQKFTRHVAVSFPSGISEAVQDLMKKALKK